MSAPGPSAEELLRRELRIMGVHPGTPEWNGAMAAGRAGLPTSARLRQLQEALDASQADLTRVERERDGVREELAEQADRVEDLEATLAMRTRQLREVQHDRDHLAQERDLAREETPRGWMVARKGGRYCERCEREIRRGEAYRPEPGTGGLLVHIHCPGDATQIPHS